MRPVSPQKSTWALLLANLIPLTGVIFLHWNLYAILFTYWAESAVIGFFNVVKMWQAKAPVFVREGKVIRNHLPGDKLLTSSEQHKIRYFLIPFFVVHYSGFMAGHFFFLFSVLPELSSANFSLLSVLNQSWFSVTLTLLSLFVSHGISYYEHFIQNEEYWKTNVAFQMFAPYKRIFVMQFTIIIGAFLLVITGGYSPLVLGLLVLLKIWLDKLFHQKTHRSAEMEAVPI